MTAVVGEIRLGDLLLKLVSILSGVSISFFPSLIVFVHEGVIRVDCYYSITYESSLS